MAPPVVYKPAEIGVWVRLGAQTLRSDSGLDDKASGLGEAVRGAFDKVLDSGKSAFAGLSGKGIEKLEYRLSDDNLQVFGIGPTQTIAWRDIRKIENGKRGAATLVLARGTLTIKPYAWLSVANVRLPMGWMRNGLEVGYETLIQEIAARARIEVAG